MPSTEPSMDQQDALASEAFARGRRDRLNGFSPAANPFHTGSAESEQYRQGQLSAQDEINANAKPRRESWENQNDGWLYAGRTSSRGNP